MQFCKVRLESGETRPALLERATILLLKPGRFLGLRSLADLLHHDNPREVARELLDDRARPIPVSQAKLLAPVDEQEIWAAGVTYKRSQEARERESIGAARSTSRAARHGPHRIRPTSLWRTQRETWYRSPRPRVTCTVLKSPSMGWAW